MHIITGNIVSLRHKFLQFSQKETKLCQKRLAEGAREARHFVDEAAFAQLVIIIIIFVE